MENLFFGKAILSLALAFTFFGDVAEARRLQRKPPVLAEGQQQSFQAGESSGSTVQRTNVPLMYELPAQINMDTPLGFGVKINNQGDNSGDRLRVCLTRSDDPSGCSNLSNFRDPIAENFRCQNSWSQPTYYCYKNTTWTAIGGEPGSYQFVGYNTGTHEFSLPRHFTVTAEASSCCNGDVESSYLYVIAPSGGNTFRPEDPVRFKFKFSKNNLPQNARMKANIVPFPAVCNPTLEIPSGEGWTKLPLTPTTVEYNYFEQGSLFPRGANTKWTVCYRVYSGNSKIGPLRSASFTVQ